jgi:hypothetical protein
MNHGHSVWVNLPAGGGCASDIRVVYMNGGASERRGVETCNRNGVTWR